MAPRTITPQESDVARRLLANARRAMQQIADYDQKKVDRLCQAIGWAYMNVTWVSRPIPEDKPSKAELFGEFCNTPVPVGKH